MRIAIIGSGVAGLTAAYLLHREHEIVVFESGDHIGGHVRTERVRGRDADYDVDTGFVVYNERTYPLFTRLLARVGVATQPTTMSFSVSCRKTGLEWCGTSLSTVFAQKRNLFRASFLRMLLDVLRFNRTARRLLVQEAQTPTLRQFIAEGGYGRGFVEHYLVPMGAAIWSMDPARMLEFPTGFFLRFFENHGLLNARRQLPWRVIRGGSFRYVEALTRGFHGRIRLRTAVDSLSRDSTGVTVRTALGGIERFEHAVVATHSDQALALLSDPTPAEREILGAIPYQNNEAVLHTDDTVLPRSPRARASWNYHVPLGGTGRVIVTYDMTRLQNLPSSERFCVSLNPTGEVSPTQEIRRIVFEHPIFDAASVGAQRRHAEISGTGRVHFCGAYWGNGFHEDGVRSALAACVPFGAGI